MPSDKDPSNITVDSGQAGQNSVKSGSLQTGGTGAGGVSLPISARQVTSDPPEGVGGSRVQFNIEQLDHDAPRRPNYLNEDNFNVNNPSNVTYPDTVKGRWHDNGSNTEALLTNKQKPQIKGIIFPADRGILAVKSLQGTTTIEQALDLEGIFDESRRHFKQADYTSAASAGDVSDLQGGTLPQGIELRNRVPMSSSSYSATYDTYPNDWDGYQIAEATINVDVGSSGDQGVFEVVHYYTLGDYKQAKSGSRTPPTYASFSEESGNLTYFYDDDTSTSVSIDGNAFSFSMNNTSDTDVNAPDKKYLSGVLHYDNSDEYSLDFDVDGLFSNSFLSIGVALRTHPGEDNHKRTYLFTKYDGNGTSPGSTATYSTSSDVWAIQGGDKCIEADPEFWASDPFGRSDTKGGITTNSANLLINTETNFYTEPSSVSDNRLQEEVFSSEVLRHQHSTVHPSNTGSNTMDPSIGVNWDTQTQSHQDLTDSNQSVSDELQVGPVPPSVSTFEKAEGGALMYPHINYSTDSDYQPTNNSVDYSGASGDRYYTRAFDTFEPLREGKIRIIGENTSGSIWNDFKYQKGRNYGGHPEGLRIQIAPAYISDQKWWDLGRDYGDGDGVKVSVNEVSNQEVVVTYRTDTYTTAFDDPNNNNNLSNDVYPLAWRVTVFGASNVALSDDFALYKVKWEKV